jgi:hypothetical protein
MKVKNRAIGITSIAANMLNTERSRQRQTHISLPPSLNFSTLTSDGYRA